ncbi:MAG: ZIP family metal transporter [Acidobacteria bacterium]|nr:ZIP family metal transporter [Acidobacteriota bacterium]
MTGIAVAAAAAGMWLTRTAHLARRALPFSAGVLVGISVFWILPELGQHFGWPLAVLAMAGGVGTLWIIDHFVYPVCPTCSHTHDHDSCSTELHGFATPLIAAAALHSLLDGTAIAAAAGGGDSRFSAAMTLALAFHKLPEGVAFGVILHSALRSRRSAMLAVTLAEAATILGGLLESILAPHLGADWVYLLLALAGGSFLYLGWHAVHTEWRRRGAFPAFAPALTGAASAAVLQHGVRLFLR